MAVTCYAMLQSANGSSAGPPAQFTGAVQYHLVDAATNAMVTCLSTGTPAGQLNVILNAPVASQATVITALQQAIQNIETATPGLTFIWLSL